MDIFKKIILTMLVLALGVMNLRAADVLVECESFEEKGGWQVDQQFMDAMGSPYLIAHGLGKPVTDASTTVNFPEKGVSVSGMPCSRGIKKAGSYALL